jgi:exodeoxyribonuclease-3
MGKLIATTNPDIICLQETKLNPENISCFNIVGFYTYWNCSTARKGYSGVSIWSREKPLSVSTELPGAPTELENEGRILTAYYPGYAVVNTYTPNTLRASDKPVEGWDSVKNGNERKDTYDYYIGMRMAWDKALSKHLERLKEEVGDVIWCGDLNVARSLNDIHNGKMTKDKINSEKANRNRASRIKELEKRYSKAEEVLQYGTIAGLRHEEREGLDKVLSNGFSDAYRELYPEKYGFTYWDTTKKSFRSSNNGWRIDYFIISNNLLSCVQSIDVYKSIGEHSGKRKVSSDHAPICLKFYPNFVCSSSSITKLGIEGKTNSKNDQVIFNNLSSVYLSSTQRIQFSEALRNIMSGIKKIHGNQCIEGPKAELLKKLEIKKLLGSGSFGMVYSSCAPQPCNDNSYKFAVKVAKINKTPFKSPFATNLQPWHEILLLRDHVSPLVKSGKSPNLPVISDVYTCDSCSFDLHKKKSSSPCVIMLTELATGGSLSNWLSEERPQDHLYSCLFQVMAGIHALQAYPQILNNDIKTENILCYKVNPGGYWEYQIHGKTFYVPNYGDLFIVNDFGVSMTFSPDILLANKKNQKTKDLGMRYAMIIDDEYSPLNATTNWLSPKQEPTTIAWGIPSKKMTGPLPHPYIYCQSLNIKKHSKGGVGVINIKTGKITGPKLLFTNEQERHLLSLEIPNNPNDPAFYIHPEIIPPLEFRWDTQDAIRMFTGGDRTTQPGTHNKYDTVKGLFLKQLQLYVINTGEQVSIGGRMSSARRLRCAGNFSGRNYVGSYNISPATDIAGYFLTDFFTKVNNWTEPSEDQIVLSTYILS